MQESLHLAWTGQRIHDRMRVSVGKHCLSISWQPIIDFWPRNHQVNLVRIKDTLYSVDVGFGGLGPTKPLPLIENTISPWGATAAEMRLTYHISENSFVQGVWSYEHRVSKSTNWTPVYHFGLTRFTEKDFNIMNLAVSTQRTSLFTKSGKQPSTVLQIVPSDFPLKSSVRRFSFMRAQLILLGC